MKAELENTANQYLRDLNALRDAEYALGMAEKALEARKADLEETRGILVSWTPFGDKEIINLVVQRTLLRVRKDFGSVEVERIEP